MENKTEKLTFPDVKNKITEHLKTVLNKEEKFEIFYARQSEVRNVWTVSVELEEKTAGEHKIAEFVIDATTGEIKEFKIE
ncbi:hypothetical protein MSIBF_A1810002 [groundwater metagenome]|uniref:PepSY domain-containing protein n=1 Tax=groundwater metagenome TaxID=717931 RepID=A0A098E8W6_9ZZZZ